MHQTLDSNRKTAKSKCYNYVMLFFAIISIVPLMFRYESRLSSIIEWVALSVFLLDYIAKWTIADLRGKNKGIKAFVLYPLGFWALIDLITILPAIAYFNRGFTAIRILRVFKILRVVKVFKGSKQMNMLFMAIKSEKRSLLGVLAVAAMYVYVTALAMFCCEPSIPNFFDAVYWAITALTTVGYGDIYPVTTLGKCISMASSLVGIAIVALPSSIITASYLSISHNMQK